MVKPTQQDSSEIHFRTPDAHEWTEAAQQELGGANPVEKLQISKGDLVIKPYYKKSDVKQSDFLVPASDSKFYGPRSWLNMPHVNVLDEKKANMQALQYLNTGADGILFVINRSDINFDILLASVAMEHCAVSLQVEPGYEKEAERFLNSTGNQNLTGCFFYRQPNNITQILKSPSTAFLTCGIGTESNENPIDELVQILESGVSILDRFTDNGHSAEVIASQIAFHLSLDADFFLSIAKLKALRKCWYTILQAYRVSNIDVRIHATSQTWIKESFQPHGNLIKSTTAALAAVTGGCNYLTVQPEGDNEPGNRAARLVSAILREESYLSKVADPTAGSYYLESLIDQLTEKVWQKFQTRIAL
jgi:methylmalonyl-CoA mutase